MIRLTLRQFRAEAVAGFGALAGLAILLALTGPHLARLNDAFRHSCEAARDCATTPNPVLLTDVWLQAVLPLVVIIAPAVIGLFLGAPLIARELETGTFRLAWTQSVTRERWFTTRIAIVGLMAIAMEGLAVWMVDWWSRPVDQATQNRFDLGPFGWHGVAPMGYAAFAFGLGAASGAVLRRTVPAMGVTLAGFVAARLVAQHWIRPHLASPMVRFLSLVSTGHFGTVSLDASTGAYSLIPPPEAVPNGWVLSTALDDRAGAALTSGGFLRACPGFAAPPDPATIQAVHDACVATLSKTYGIAVTYQPAYRFWAFQWAEAGLFVLAAAVLCGVAYRWVRRR